MQKNTEKYAILGGFHNEIFIFSDLILKLGIDTFKKVIISYSCMTRPNNT